MSVPPLPSSKPCVVDLYLSDWIWRKVESECGQIWANCDDFIHGRAQTLLLHSLSASSTNILKHSSQTKAQTWVNKSSAAISYMERGKITGCLTATAQPGTIISVLAMHTAQITHKHLKNVAHILHEYLSNTLHQSAKVVWTNMSMRKGCPMKLSIGFFLVIW